MKRLLLIATAFLISGCLTLPNEPTDLMTFDSGTTMQVKVMERVGIFGRDWFAGAAEICHKGNKDSCIQQTFHGSGGAIANWAVYGAVAAAVYPASTVSAANNVDQKLRSQVFNQNFIKVRASSSSKAFAIGDD